MGPPRGQAKTSVSSLPVDNTATFTQDEIEDLIRKTTQEAINDAVAKAVKATTELFQQKLDGLSKRLSKQNDEIVTLKNELQALKQNQNHLEQYSRRNNIRIRGLNVTKREDCRKVVAEFLNRNLRSRNEDETAIAISPDDIEAAHPLPVRQRKLNQASGGSAHDPSSLTRKPSPMVIVRFFAREKRDHIMQMRRSLKGTGFTIMEDLTAANAELLHKLTISPRYQSARSWEGKIYALPTGADATSGKKKIDIFDEQ